MLGHHNTEGEAMSQMVITPVGEVVELTCWAIVHRVDLMDRQPNYKERCFSERWIQKEGWMDLHKASVRVYQLFGVNKWECPSEVAELLEAV
jgi:hypothetical protein